MVEVDAALLDAFPDVRLDHDNAAQFAGFLEGTYLVDRCAECDWWHDPPRALCPRCWGDAVVPTPIAGTATIVALTHLHGVPPVEPDPAGGTPWPPWPLASVELSEQPGLRVAAHLVGPGAAELGIGDAVVLTWVVDGTGRRRPAFRAPG